MQIAVSIEPFLTAEKSKLIQYLDEIIRISHVFANQKQKIILHFDYFRANPAVFELVQSYTNQIDIDLHLMQEPAPSLLGFRSVSHDVRDLKNGLISGLLLGSATQRGVVLDLGCEIEPYYDLIRTAQTVIVMTVPCGKSGQSFNASALDLISQIRLLNPNALIVIDGGVNENNINLLKNVGVDVVVVGNYAKKCYENGNFELGINRLLHD